MAIKYGVYWCKLTDKGVKMKTVMDAVNWFKGGNLLCEFLGSGLEDCDWVLLECLLQSEDCADKVGDICTGGVEFDSGFYRLICDYHSYAVEVALLSRAPWIKGAPLEEYQAADKEVLKMESETVEVDGMVYEIGKYYLFCDSFGLNEVYDKLVRVHQGEEYRFVSGLSSVWRRCRAVTGEAGTITPAPVDLVDGAAYEFTVSESGAIRHGMYNNCHKKFIVNLSHTVPLRNAINITRLVPEPKVKRDEELVKMSAEDVNYIVGQRCSR